MLGDYTIWTAYELNDSIPAIALSNKPSRPFVLFGFVIFYSLCPLWDPNNAQWEQIVYLSSRHINYLGFWCYSQTSEEFLIWQFW